MKAFLEEYGIAVFTLVCIAILVLIATPVGQAIRDGIVSLVESFVADPTSANFGGFANT